VPTYPGVPGPAARSVPGHRHRVTREATIHPVVFVHGTRTSSAIWAQQVRSVRDHGHEASTVDLPGHGERAAERFTFRGALHAIDEAVDRCAEPPVLVGLSLGGYTSLAYAARHPRRVAGLVLSGCSTEIRGKPLSAYRWASLRVAETLRPGRHTWHVVADMLHAMRGYSPIADLRRLAVPVHLVNGARDPLRMDERRFVLAHPLARLHVVPRAGHDVNTHAPAAFDRILLRALQEVPRRTHHVAPAVL
jgi:pimeloyl-ACP methyl ester carboxylesterase